MTNEEYKLHLVSHTHWDREWYQTFQQFRLRLVHLVDHVLNLIETDPHFEFFMLDGQTIVLDDYLEVRPEKKAELIKHIQSGKILVGPWYILPDEFLVSPEATIRNLLIGERICKEFGGKMMVGYIPDPFGHIGQMPQILRGFGIENACLWRGLGDEPCEFWWAAPDGSRVFMAYLRDSYGNGSGLNTGQKEAFVEDVCRARDSLAPHSATSHLLIMHGTDHMEPQSDTSEAISFFNSVPVTPPTHLLHSTLPQYLSDVNKEIEGKGVEIPTVTGELRNCQKAFLLPGVLSTRIWIKQRNHACQSVLEKWAEPFSAWANLIAESNQLSANGSHVLNNRIIHPESALKVAWRLLIQCHPHDSICGCSIDQVHEEMRARFDQVGQIGEEIVSQSLSTLAEAIHTNPKPEFQAAGVVTVFNPVSGPRSDWVETEFQLPEDIRDFEMIDENGKVMPHQFLGSSSKLFVNSIMTRTDFKYAVGMVSDGRVGNLVVTGFEVKRQDSSALLHLTFSEIGEPDLTKIQEDMYQVQELIDDPQVTQYIIKGNLAATTKIIFLAQDIPGYGYRTFWVRALSSEQDQPQAIKLGFVARTVLSLAARFPFIQKLAAKVNNPSDNKPPFIIENEFFRVEASPQDGSLNVLDKRSGQSFRGLNCFVDGGDCGDEYNYSPPERDQVIRGARLLKAHLEKNSVRQTIHLDLQLIVPASLSEDRKSRSAKMVVLPIQTSIFLYPGVARIDIHSQVDNQAQDHRLRVHFPAPLVVQTADCDGHFEVVHRPVSPSLDGNLPYPGPSWSEQPRTEMPQLAFTDISDGKDSLLIANRGLPEVAVLPTSDGCHEISLTLLRCVGYLSREDLSTRKGHAGPDMLTPGAQLPGIHTFDYAILPHTASDTVATYHQAYAFNIPLRSAKTTFHNGPLPVSGSMIEVAPPEFVISSIKTSEDGCGWIVRGYNISSHTLPVTLKPWKSFEKADRVNLLESSEASLSLGSHGEVSFPVSAFQVISIKFS